MTTKLVYEATQHGWWQPNTQYQGEPLFRDYSTLRWGNNCAHYSVPETKTWAPVSATFTLETDRLHIEDLIWTKRDDNGWHHFHSLSPRWHRKNLFSLCRWVLTLRVQGYLVDCWAGCSIIHIDEPTGNILIMQPPDGTVLHHRPVLVGEFEEIPFGDVDGIGRPIVNGKFQYGGSLKFSEVSFRCLIPWAIGTKKAAAIFRQEPHLFFVQLAKTAGKPNR